MEALDMRLPPMMYEARLLLWVTPQMSSRSIDAIALLMAFYVATSGSRALICCFSRVMNLYISFELSSATLPIDLTRSS
jgi:hypothetical protein